jgi:hypothetical protein
MVKGKDKQAYLGQFLHRVYTLGAYSTPKLVYIPWKIHNITLILFPWLRAKKREKMCKEEQWVQLCK